jgi:hypothetical protein
MYPVSGLSKGICTIGPSFSTPVAGAVFLGFANELSQAQSLLLCMASLKSVGNKKGPARWSAPVFIAMRLRLGSHRSVNPHGIGNDDKAGRGPAGEAHVARSAADRFGA